MFQRHPMHNSTGEGARKELCCLFLHCPGSQMEDTTKVVLPAFWAEMGNRCLLGSAGDKMFQTHPMHNSTGEGASKEFSL